MSRTYLVYIGFIDGTRQTMACVAENEAEAMAWGLRNVLAERRETGVYTLISNVDWGTPVVVPE